MKKFGLEQGRKGLPGLSDDIRKVCVRSDATVDLESYEKGFDMGWSEYCTPTHGYENGKKGDEYKSFCPPEKEELYHEKFLIGKKVYEKKDQLRELEEKIKNLTPEADQNLSAKEELGDLNENLRVLNREIQSLEQQGMNPVHSN